MRGRLRVYLGAAPGVGKTYRMLDEGRRRAERGTDVVIGYVECHGRSRTEEMIGDLETVPRLTRTYRGIEFTEMDVDAVLARRPKVALVDELAHTNVPGGRNEKRWQDVRELLNAGIEVVTTVNIQHLESLNDVVEKITGVPQRETVPDEVVRAADQVELVDMSPESLRRRMAHGSVYAPEKIDAALSNYFRVGNLTALRELALLWVADRVDEGLKQYRADHEIDQIWEARERVVVALTGGAEGGTLIRRAARIAARAVGGDLLAVHVARSDGLADASPADLAAQRRLVESLGGTYHMVVGDDVTRALLDFARAVSATQLVLGTSRRNRVSRLMFRGIGETVIALSGDIDVHMVTHERAGKGRWAGAPWGRSEPRRQAAAFAAAILAPPALAAVLTHYRGPLNLTSQVLVFLVALVAIARLGGLLPALLAAVSSSLLLNYYFIPPIHQFTIADPNNIFALAAFVLVALTVASVVDTAGRQSRRAAHASAEAQTLATLAGSVLRGEEAIPALLERSREAFGMESVALLEHAAPDGAEDGPSLRPDGWRIVAAAGPRPCTVTCGGRRHGGGQRRRRPRPARPGAARRRSARADRVRRPGRGRAAAGQAGGSRGGGQAARRGRPDAHGAARRGQPRPAHPARLGEGSRHEPAQPRRDLEPGGFRGTARHRGRVAGPADPDGGEPARHEPAAGRRAQPPPAAGHPR